MAKINLLGLFSLLSLSVALQAETIGSSDSANSAEKYQITQSPPVTLLREIPVESVKGGITNLSAITSFEKCQLFEWGGFFYMFIGRGTDLHNGIYGIGFPPELLDIRKNLKEGFTSESKTVISETTIEYRAQYHKGVLTVETIQKTPGFSTIELHSEFSTSTNLVDSSRIVQSISASVPGNDINTKVVCGEAPMS